MAQGLVGFGVVKAILSGDTIIITNPSAQPGKPAPELQLSLSGVVAPRLSRHPDQKDEPFGFASREFLRKISVGKPVKFRVDYRSEKANRSFASIWIPSPAAAASSDGTAAAAPPSMSVNLAMAASGMARVSVTGNEAASTLPAAETEVLTQAGRAAEMAGYGIHSSATGAEASSSIRNIIWNPSTETLQTMTTETLSRASNGVPAVIEQVLGGAAFRVYIPSESVMVTFSLAAVQCPRATPSTGAAPSQAAPVAAASKPLAASAAAGVVSKSIAIPASSGTKPGGYGAAAAAAAGGGTTAASLVSHVVGAGASSSSSTPVSATTSTATAAATGVDPIGLEAKLFTEGRLLHRDVLLHVGGVDKFGALVGRMDHPAGDIAIELLKNGLAKISDWSASFTTPAHVGTLRAAERTAKASKLKLWSSYEPTRIAGSRSYEGRVIEVVSGDTLVVLTNPGHSITTPADERRVSLSSIRAPRLGNARREEKDAPYAWESKDWMRRNWIGKDVHVTVDYTRAAGAGGGGAGAEENAGAGATTAAADRVFASVVYTTKKGDPVNIAVGLIAEGLAEVVRHRHDEERSSQYDDLLAAEDAAKAGKKGLYAAGKEAPTHRFADLTTDSSKSKAQFSYLQRSKTMRAIPEYVFAGGRVKAFLPADNLYIMFGVAGVRCPAVGAKGTGANSKNARAGEPLGAEALAYMREAVMQQEVEIEAEDIDKNGTILGPMWVGKGGARKNVGADLLRKGLASTIGSAISRGVREADELTAAEGEAKAVKRGVWQYITEEEEDAEEDEFGSSASSSSSSNNVTATMTTSSSSSSDFPSLGSGSNTGAISKSSSWGGAATKSSSSSSATSSSGGASTLTTIPCVLADIRDATSFTFHAEADRGKIDEVNAFLDQMWKENGSKHASLNGEVKKGKVVACLWQDASTGGKLWARARIDGKHKDIDGEPPFVPGPEEGGLVKWDITYIDLGTKSVSTVMRMRPLEGTAAGVYPAFAREATLAFLRVPSLKQDYGNEAADFLSDAWGRPLLAVVFGRDSESGKLLVDLVDAESNVSMSETLVAAGFARISRSTTSRIRRRAGPGKIQDFAAAAARATEAGDRELAHVLGLEDPQEDAKDARRGMWTYGDVGDSDLEDNKRGSGGGAPKSGGWAAAAGGKK